jgi:hypothetical protein
LANLKKPFRGGFLIAFVYISCLHTVASRKPGAGRVIQKINFYRL